MGWKNPYDPNLSPDDWAPKNLQVERKVNEGSFVNFKLTPCPPLLITIKSGGSVQPVFLHRFM